MNVNQKIEKCTFGLGSRKYLAAGVSVRGKTEYICSIYD